MTFTQSLEWHVIELYASPIAVLFVIPGCIGNIHALTDAGGTFFPSTSGGTNVLTLNNYSHHLAIWSFAYHWCCTTADPPASAGMNGPKYGPCAYNTPIAVYSSGRTLVYAVKHD